MDTKTVNIGGTGGTGGTGGVTALVPGQSLERENCSLFIPVVDERIKNEYIFKKLCILNIGYIHKLTAVPCKFQPGFKRMIIRIRWNNEKHTVEIRRRLMAGETVKFVYDLPWFWVISAFEPRREITCP